MQTGWIDNKLEQTVISLIPVRQVWKSKWHLQYLYYFLNPNKRH